MFDLNVYSFNRIAGKEIPDLPGLYTASPPRKPARGREEDLLALLVQFDEHGSVVTGAQADVLEKLSSVYYNTRGTVTAALKAVAIQLNDRLMARNLRVAKDGSPILGFFMAAVLHGDLLYIAHSGPVHTYAIGQDGIQYFYDPQGAGRGLGVSRTATVRFYRTQVQAGDLLIMSARPPEYWSTRTLVGSAQLPLANIRRRLLTQAGDDVCFAMLRIKPGSGEIKTVNLAQAENMATAAPANPSPATTSPATTTPAATETAAPSGSASSLSTSGLAAPPQTGAEDTTGVIPPADAHPETPSGSPRKTGISLGGQQVQAAPAQPAEASGFGRLSGMVNRPPHKSASPRPASPPAGVKPAPARVQHEAQVEREKALRAVKAETRARGAVSTGLNTWRSIQSRIQNFFGHLLAGVLPGQADRMPALSTGSMVFIAIAIPLVIVAIATTVYVQVGNGEEHHSKLVEAQRLILLAQQATDPTITRVNYQSALDTLNEAAKYGHSDEMQTLLDQVNSSLDKLDGVQRLDMSLVATIGSDQVNFKRILPTPSEDLYLLDGDSGSVARLVYTHPGYKVDDSFTCGPNQYGGVIVSPLIDIMLAPDSNPFNAVVMGIDAYGNILYCSLDATENTAATLVPPDAGWNSIQSIYYDNGVLNVLDHSSIWRFDGGNFQFPDAPHSFFGNEVPALGSAIDINLYQDDVFILNQDSHLAVCTYNSVTPAATRCTDPSPYNVSLSGQTAQAETTMNVEFTQEITTQPPEPAIYFLNSTGRTVYQFSLGLNFVRKMTLRETSAGQVPDAPASAFTVTGSRVLVMALGNRIYTSELPAP